MLAAALPEGRREKQNTATAATTAKTTATTIAFTATFAFTIFCIARLTTIFSGFPINSFNSVFSYG